MLYFFKLPVSVQCNFLCYNAAALTYRPCSMRIRLKQILVLCLLFVIWNGNACFATTGQKTYTPSQDTTLSQRQPANSFGQDPGLRIEHNKSGPSEEHTLVFLKFDLSDIPPTAKLDSVTLTLTAQQASTKRSFEVQLGKLDQPWQESDTWEKWGPFSSFTARLAQPRLAVRTIPTSTAAGSEVRFNSTVELRETVQDWIANPGRNFGLVIFSRDVTNEYRLDFFSREGGQEKEKPTLNISYQLDDTTPVQIESVQVEEITNNSVKITWKTDRPADSYVDYGTTSNYGTRFGHTTLRTDHSVVLPNLSSMTTYHYKVSSTTGQKVVSTSEDNTFQTSAEEASEEEEIAEEDETTDAELVQAPPDEPATTLAEEQAGQVAGTTNRANATPAATNPPQNNNRRRLQGGDLLLSDSVTLETRRTMADRIKDNILGIVPTIAIIGLLILLFRHNIGNYMQGGDTLSRPPQPPTPPPQQPPPSPRNPLPPSPGIGPSSPPAPRSDGVLDLSKRNLRS